METKTQRGDWDDATDPTHTDLSDRPHSGIGGTERSGYLLVFAGPHLGEMYKLDPTRATIVGRGTNVDVRFNDTGCSRQHARFIMGPEGYLVEDMESKNGTFVSGERVQAPRLLADGERIAVGADTVLKFCLQDKIDEEFQQRLRDAALIDGLTQLVRRDYFMRRLGVEMRHALRHRLPLAVLMIDIDRFKEVNDSFGHIVGDGVLTEVAARIASQLRIDDLAARYGGEEFAVLCRGADSSGGTVVAERIRRSMVNKPIDPEHRAIKVTVSIGVASLASLPPNSEAPTDLLKLADEALYAAKQQGRNRVVISP